MKRSTIIVLVLLLVFATGAGAGWLANSTNHGEIHASVSEKEIVNGNVLLLIKPNGGSVEFPVVCPGLSLCGDVLAAEFKYSLTGGTITAEMVGQQMPVVVVHDTDTKKGRVR